MRCTTKCSLILSLVTLMCGIGHAAEFRLRNRCQSRGPLVTLGDVAEIVAVDSRQAASLGAIELFPAPASSRQHYLSLRELQDLLLSRGVNLSEHRFSGANQVAVEAASAGEGEEPAAASETPQKENLPAVVATRPLPRGTVIRASDIEVRYDAPRGAGVRPIAALQDVVGKETSRPIAAGRALDADAVQDVLQVHRGEVVTVRVRAHGLHVRTTARALQDGRQGETIRVESLLGREPYLARVWARREAEIEQTGRESLSGAPETAGSQPPTHAADTTRAARPLPRNSRPGTSAAAFPR